MDKMTSECRWDSVMVMALMAFMLVFLNRDSIARTCLLTYASTSISCAMAERTPGCRAVNAAGRSLQSQGWGEGRRLEKSWYRQWKRMIEYSQNVACLDFTISMIEKYIEIACVSRVCAKLKFELSLHEMSISLARQMQYLPKYSFISLKNVRFSNTVKKPNRFNLLQRK